MKFTLSISKSQTNADPPTGREVNIRKSNLKHPLGFNIESDDDIQNDLVDNSGEKSIAASVGKVDIKFKSVDVDKDELDPTIYSYDEFIDNKSSDRSAGGCKNRQIYLGYTQNTDVDRQIVYNDSHCKSTSTDSKEVKESRYMEKMITIAKKRGLERDIVFERQLLKEDASSGMDISEVFVTGAYRRKLEERKRFEEEQRIKDEMDLKRDESGLHNFHSNLLNKGFSTRSKNSQV